MKNKIQPNKSNYTNFCKTKFGLLICVNGNCGINPNTVEGEFLNLGIELRALADYELYIDMDTFFLTESLKDDIKRFPGDSGNGIYKHSGDHDIVKQVVSYIRSPIPA